MKARIKLLLALGVLTLEMIFATGLQAQTDTVEINGKVFLKLGQEAHIIGAYNPQIMQFELGVREEGVLGFYFSLVDTANNNLQNFVEVISNNNNGHPIGHAYFGSWDAANSIEVTQGIKISQGKAVSHFSYSDYEKQEAISFQIAGETGCVLSTGRHDYSFAGESMFEVINPTTEETTFKVYANGDIYMKPVTEAEACVGCLYTNGAGDIKIKLQ